MEPLSKRFWLTFAALIALQLLYMTYTKTDVFQAHHTSYYDALQAKKADALQKMEAVHRMGE